MNLDTQKYYDGATAMAESKSELIFSVDNFSKAQITKKVLFEHSKVVNIVSNNLTEEYNDDYITAILNFIDHGGVINIVVIDEKFIKEGKSFFYNIFNNRYLRYLRSIKISICHNYNHKATDFMIGDNDKLIVQVSENAHLACYNSKHVEKYQDAFDILLQDSTIIQND